MDNYNSKHTGFEIDNAVERIKNTPGNGAITYQDVNAAPDGFGLGDKCVMAKDNDWNNAILDGKFFARVNSPDGAVWYGDVSRLADEGGCIVQKANRQFVNIDFVADMLIAERRGVIAEDGVTINWGEWEWGTPPMRPNVEYRTIYRLHREPLYVKSDDNGVVYYRKSSDTIWKIVSTDSLSLENLGFVKKEKTIYNYNKLNGNYITNPNDLPNQSGLWLTANKNSMVSKPDFHDTNGRATITRFNSESNYGFDLYASHQSNKIGFRTDLQSDDSWNEIVTRKGGGTLIQVGSYVGTGNYGINNAVQISFNFPPKIVVISVDEIDSETTTYCRQVIFIKGQIFTHAGFLDENKSGIEINNINISGWGTNTMSFYVNAYQTYSLEDYQQMNAAGVTYRYCGLG